MTRNLSIRKNASFPCQPDQQAGETTPSLNTAEIRNADLTDMIAKTVTIAAILCALFLAIYTIDQLTDMLDKLRTHKWSNIMLVIGQALLAINIVALIWRIILVLRYKPIEECNDEELPTCTVVVPAYNEGKQVLYSIRSLAASDYPAGKLEIIAVNDGSKDDTWYWLNQAAQEFPKLVTPVNCVVNRGKRYALNEGFQKAKGEVIITVDSDSEVEPQTLRRMTCPFVQNRMVGAVAGNVRVLNRREGILPRMLDVTFTYSFDFIRASQSMVNTVFCTPGALAAYRADIVKSVRAEWLAQTFFGLPAQIGEDRAMTNHILRKGFHVLFQQNAVVYTKVPTKYGNLCKMFLRWARSNVRETLIITGFAFRRFRDTPATGARANLLLHLIQMTLPILLRVQTVICLIICPFAFSSHLLLGTILASLVSMTIYTLRHRNSNGLWAVPYSIFWIVGLSWIAPYALLTAHKNAWMTRQLTPAKNPKTTPVLDKIQPVTISQ